MAGTREHLVSSPIGQETRWRGTEGLTFTIDKWTNRLFNVDVEDILSETIHNQYLYCCKNDFPASQRQRLETNMTVRNIFQMEFNYFCCKSMMMLRGGKENNDTHLTWTSNWGMWGVLSFVLGEAMSSFGTVLRGEASDKNRKLEIDGTFLTLKIYRIINWWKMRNLMDSATIIPCHQGIIEVSMSVSFNVWSWRVDQIPFTQSTAVLI